jgi:8-oxo-dGTP pyrophosphatase MutT (NUDIX family)
MLNQLADALVQRLGEPLPGREAQFRMAAAHRMPPGFSPDVSRARLGGVLIALYPDQGTVRTVLMKRPDYSGAHSGQVSFPGGKMEPSDTDIIATALREAEEEVGLIQGSVRVLGQLSELYIPVSNFLVHPVVGVLERPPILVPNQKEVERILLPELHHFLRTDIIGERHIPVMNGLKVKAPFYDVEGQTVWGATAMILSEFTEILQQIGFEGSPRP